MCKSDWYVFSFCSTTFFCFSPLFKKKKKCRRAELCNLQQESPLLGLLGDSLAHRQVNPGQKGRRSRVPRFFSSCKVWGGKSRSVVPLQTSSSSILLRTIKEFYLQSAEDARVFHALVRGQLSKASAEDVEVPQDLRDKTHDMDTHQRGAKLKHTRGIFQPSSTCLTFPNPVPYVLHQDQI